MPENTTPENTMFDQLVSPQLGGQQQQVGEVGASNLMFNPNFQPQTQAAGTGVQPGQGPNIFSQSAAGYGTGMGTLTDVANPYAVNMTMNQFLNPYRSQVIDNAMMRSQQAQNMDLNQVRGQAAQSGAYGGARQGLVESELMDRYSQNENEMLARMLQQGFDTRANLSLQTLGQRAGAGQALVGGAQTGLGIGQSLLGQQAQAGAQQRALGQQVLGQAGSQTNALINHPLNALSTALHGVQGNPLAGNVSRTESYQPGMFDYLSFGSGLLGGGK